MKEKTKQDPDYDKYVNLIDKENYTLYTQLLHEGESIVCPTDTSMKILKDKNGKILLQKMNRGKVEIKEI